MVNKHWFRQWLCAIRQQAISWANVKPVRCCHICNICSYGNVAEKKDNLHFDSKRGWPLATTAGTTNLVPSLLMSSHCNSFEDWAPVDDIYGCPILTHWGRVTHICVSRLSILGSDNGLSPSRRQAIIWTNTGILLTGPLGTIFSEILIEIYSFLFKKMCLKVSSAKWRPFVSASMC